MHDQDRKVERTHRAGALPGLLLLVLLASLSVPLPASTAHAKPGDGGRLTIRFSGLEKTGGVLLVSLADSRENFESAERAFLSARVPVQGTRESAVFEGVAAGEYAVKAFHDMNGNRKLDIGLLGPTENFGFSNNVMGFMGPPDFDDAKFHFDGSELTIEIEAR